MRTDFIIAILLAICAVVASIPVTLIPVLFPASRWSMREIFYGGIFLALVFFGLAIYVASADAELHMFQGKRLIGLCVMMLGIIASFVGLRLFLSQNDAVAAETQKNEPQHLPMLAQSAPPPHQNPVEDSKLPEKKSGTSPISVTGGSQSTPMGTVNVQPGSAASFGQSGGVTAHTVNISQSPPPPEVNIVRATIPVARTDGTADWVITIAIVAASVPRTIVVEARDPKGGELGSIGVNPLTAGTVQFGSWVNAGRQYARIQSPMGQYDIQVNGRSDSKPEFAFGFNQ